jgi:hypothetical protein
LPPSPSQPWPGQDCCRRATDKPVPRETRCAETPLLWRARITTRIARRIATDNRADFLPCDRRHDGGQGYLYGSNGLRTVAEPNHHQVERRDHIAPVCCTPHEGKRILGDMRPQLAISIDPERISVPRIDLLRFFRRQINPPFRYDLFTVPSPSAQQQVAQAGEVTGGETQAAGCIGVGAKISSASLQVPAPTFRSADR